jgi:chaperonin GroES
MNWKPIGDQVLLKQLEKQDKTQSGIIIMNSLDDYIECDVMAIGDGLFTQTGNKIPMTVSVGDRIKIYSGTLGSQKKVQLENNDFILVREHEIAMINTKP